MNQELVCVCTYVSMMNSIDSQKWWEFNLEDDNIYIYSVYIWLEYTLCFYLGSNWDCVWESQKGGGNDNEYMWGDSGYGT